MEDNPQYLTKPVRIELDLKIESACLVGNDVFLTFNRPVSHCKNEIVISESGKRAIVISHRNSDSGFLISPFEEVVLGKDFGANQTISFAEKIAEKKEKPVVIEVPLINCEDITIIEGLPDTAILHEKHIEFKWKQRVELTEDGEKKEKFYHGNKSLLKNKIVYVGCGHSQGRKIYETSVYVGGDAEYTFRFKTFSEALEVKKQILQWLIAS